MCRTKTNRLGLAPRWSGREPLQFLTESLPESFFFVGVLLFHRDAGNETFTFFSDSTEFRDRLAPFLAQSLGNMRRRITPELPDLKDQPSDWFRHWDQVWCETHYSSMQGRGMRDRKAVTPRE